MISHHRPCGRWYFARLIRQAETLELQLHSQPPSKRTALSPLKRSCFRFAALTLRYRTEPALRAAPVFRSAYFPKKLFSFFSKTLDLQPLCGLRWAGEASLSPFCAPKCPFRTFRCFAWLIHDFAPSPMRALVFRSAYSASRNARASAAFAASIKAHRAVSSETLMLQVRCAHPPMPHPSLLPLPY